METKKTELIFRFADSAGNIQPMAFVHPVTVLSTDRIDQVKDRLAEVQKAVDSGYYAAGYVSYEAAPAFDPLMQVHQQPKLPLLWFGIYEHPIPEDPTYSPGDFHVSEWKPNVSEAEYQEAIEFIKEAIACGVTYQTNYTLRLKARFEGDDRAFFEQLMSIQKTLYGAYLNIGRFRILSASPELFFRWDKQKVITRPMKGTIQRGRYPQEDAANQAQLKMSDKNRAENLMIVDLLRNDISKVAKTGKVNVPQLFTIEKYPTIFQMTSTVAAETKDSTTLESLFTALFPCGSITGAPKLSTMEIINRLEQEPRDVYCGAIGLMIPGGDAIFNVGIRTVVIDVEEGSAVYGVGGGITWDSTVDGEYEEVLTKAKLLTDKASSFSLIETLRLEDGKYAYWQHHLQRLAASAEYFDFNYSEDDVMRCLQEHASKYPTSLQKVRLLVSKAGEVQIFFEDLISFSEEPRRIALANQPISRWDRFLYHKTTRREVYQYHRSQYPDVFDVLLWNEQGELTEFTTGNLVVELDGNLYTPPVDCGLLAGTFRAHLLESEKIRERIILKADLDRCTNLWYINSVRNWVPVTGA